MKTLTIILFNKTLLQKEWSLLIDDLRGEIDSFVNYIHFFGGSSFSNPQ